MEKAVLSSQWLEWWNQLVLDRSLHKHNVDFYQPSYFDSMDNEFGDVGRNTLQAFRDWWHMPAGGNTAMLHLESADNIGQYVRDFEQHANRKVRPFRMKVDLVYAGLDEVIEVNDNYVVMPIRSHLENEAWWIQKISAIG